LLHSPLDEKVEVTRRSKVRRNYLSYLRERSGKSARLKGVNFDREGVNDIRDIHAEEEAARLKEETHLAAEAKLAEKAAVDAELAAKQAEVEARHEETA
jgi:large subunit ribosomal protein L19